MDDISTQVLNYFFFFRGVSHTIDVHLKLVFLKVTDVQKEVGDIPGLVLSLPEKL